MTKITLKGISTAARAASWGAGLAAVTLAGGLAATPSAIAPRVMDPHLLTVNGLTVWCRAAQQAPHEMCTAYLVAAADTLTTFGNSGSKDGLCLTDYASADLPPLYLAWAAKHADLASSPALLGVVLSLREKWPCR